MTGGVTMIKRCKNFVNENENEKKGGENYPLVSAGEYAESLSVYTDCNGRKALVAPGWTVSGRKEENTIDGKKAGLVLYYIQKDEVGTIDWEDKSVVERLRSECKQMLWIPIEMLEEKQMLRKHEFFQKFGKNNKTEILFEKNRFEVKMLRHFAKKSEYRGVYIG